MTEIQIAAIRDAEADYHENPRPLEVLLGQCFQIRAGNSAGPAADVLLEAGREALCRTWGVDPARWDEASASWFAAYNTTWCATIETMVERERMRTR